LHRNHTSTMIPRSPKGAGQGVRGIQCVCAQDRI
jgi:hypothetical protein